MTAERLMNVIMIISVPLSVITDIDDVIMIISVPPLSSLSLIIKMLLMNNWDLRLTIIRISLGETSVACSVLRSNQPTPSMSFITVVFQHVYFNVNNSYISSVYVMWYVDHVACCGLRLTIKQTDKLISATSCYLNLGNLIIKATSLCPF